MKKEVKDMPDNTYTRRQAKNEKESEILQYQLEAFDGNEALHPKPRDAVRCVQCPPPVEFEDEGLSHINCARQKCTHCPQYPRPELEETLGMGDKKIFLIITRCFQRAHGAVRVTKV